MEDIIINIVIALMGVWATIYAASKNKFGLGDRIRKNIIKNSIERMENLLSLMSTVHNATSLAIKNQYNLEDIRKAHEKAKECANFFQQHRGRIYIFLNIGKSPIFIEITLSLAMTLELVANDIERTNITNRQDELNRLLKNFQDLYLEYHSFFARGIGHAISA